MRHLSEIEIGSAHLNGPPPNRAPDVGKAKNRISGDPTDG
jgi:hypothetical protein